MSGLFKPLVLAASLCVITLGWSSASFGVQRTFVASYGADTNPCSLGQPCRSFGIAISHVQSGGEVIVLDSAGYGVFTVTQPVSVIAPAGVYAGIFVPDYQIGVYVNATVKVLLEGLALTGNSGASAGIAAVEGSNLHLRRITVSGMGQGITADSVTAEDLFVKDNQGIGLAIGRTQSGSTATTISRSRFVNNGVGILVGDFVIVSIVDSEFTSNFWGIQVRPGDPLLVGGSRATLTCTRCSITASVLGIDVAQGNGAVAIVNLVGSQLIGNYELGQYGIQPDEGTTVNVTDSLISRWHIGVNPLPFGSAVSLGDNRLYGNLIDGSFTSTIAKQ